MVRRPAPTRWEPCSRCREIYPPDRLVHISSVDPERKRGWICDGAETNRCAEKMRRMAGAHGVR